jgi:hypothetical protein
MELRNYPLMSFCSLRNWPPNWAWVEGEKKARVSGEVGRLVKIVPSLLEDGPLYLTMEHEGNRYIGVLLFDDRILRGRVCDFLRNFCGYTIAEIGSVDSQSLGLASRDDTGSIR